MTKEFAELQATYGKFRKEYNILKQKELDFDEAINSRLEIVHQLDAVMIERGKMQTKIETLQANNTVMDSELTVIKKEILKEKSL